MSEENKPMSLNELRERIRNEHLEITCVTTVPVSITIVYTDEHKEPGYIVSLDYPPPSQQDKPFIGNPRIAEGDLYLSGDLEYPSSSYWPLKLDDVIRAMNINPEAKMWTASKDPHYIIPPDS